MNPDDLVKLLDELGKRLGPTGEHVFQIAKQQVVVEAWTGISIFILILSVALVGWLVSVLFWHKLNKRMEFKENEVKQLRLEWRDRRDKYYADNPNSTRYSFNESEPNSYNSDKDEKVSTYLSISMSAALVVVFAAIVGIVDLGLNLLSWTTAIFNPEFAALQKILAAIPR